MPFAVMTVAEEYFVRSGSLRAAPYQPVVWGGDQLTTFATDDGLPTALMRGLNLGLGGIAIYGHDIAGYQHSIGAPTTKELYFRWTELGALTPVMRTHHGTEASQNWRFDMDAETTAHFARSRRAPGCRWTPERRRRVPRRSARRSP